MSIWEKNLEKGCAVCRSKPYKQVQTAQDTNGNDDMAVTVIQSYFWANF